MADASLTEGSDISVETAVAQDKSSGGLFSLPSTGLGWWAVGLMVLYVVLMLLNGLFMNIEMDQALRENVLPFYGIFMLVCGLASGIVGLTALFHKHERSWAVWFTLLPALMVLFLVIGEGLSAVGVLPGH